MNEQLQDPYQTDLSVGEILRRTRMHYGQSLEDIERSLRIRAIQIEAIETGNYSALPGRVYVIGFIRSYAEYLGLDGEKMVQLYKKQSGGKINPSATLNYPVMASDTKMPQPWQIGLSVLAVFVILGAWWSMQDRDREIVTEIPEPVATQARLKSPAEEKAADMPPQPATVANVPAGPEAPPVEAAAATVSNVTVNGATTTTAAAPSVPAEAAAIPAAKVENQNGIILNIRENSWVEIRAKDGKSIVSRVLQAGDRYYVPDRPDLTISLGNSGGVELEVQGQKLRPLGATGEVRRNIPLDAASLKKNYGS